MAGSNTIDRARCKLFPGCAERDEGFRDELQRLGTRALMIIGGIEIVMPLLVAFVNLLGIDYPHEGAGLSWLSLSISLLGACTWMSAYTSWGPRHSRSIALVSGYLAGLALIWINMPGPEFASGALRDLGTILLIAAAAVPALPYQILLLGFSMGASLLVSAGIANMPVPEGLVVVDTLISIGLCTALAAANYYRIHGSYQSHRVALQSQQDHQKAELRALTSDHAASMAKLSAALSHEFNTPVGSLKSASETLLLLAHRLGTAPPADQARLVALIEPLCASILSSTDRLSALVGRMQRFTNLDRADIQSVDVNHLIEDVGALVQPQLPEKVDLKMDLQPVPRFRGKPQPLSTVFSGLLQNAMAALKEGGTVRVSTRHTGAAVEVAIEDDGQGMAPDQLVGIFEPSFRVANGKVSSSHWGLFAARQIVREQGGDIQIASHEGTGTRVVVTLPCASQFAFATA